MAFDLEAAAGHLSACDPVMTRLVEGLGPVQLRPPLGNPFQALARAILFQQLSGKAAETIYTRFIALHSANGRFPSPRTVLATEPEQMRAVGLSRQKAAAIASLAEHFAGPLARVDFTGLGDEEIIEAVTAVRGVGRWTAEMFLMFELQRPDVLPVNDLGINRAIRNQYGLSALPGPDEVRAVAAPWRPWATAACWYLWRSEDARLVEDAAAAD
jgi:DNA-3-methyladenine glycosylase II